MSYRHDEGLTLSGPVLAILTFLVAAVLVIGLLAWSPWGNGNGTVVPGQGGDDGINRSATPLSPTFVPTSTPTLPPPRP